MTFEEFDAVFDRFGATEFRLETLRRYADDEGEEFVIFLAGQLLPERSTWTVPWLRDAREVLLSTRSPDDDEPPRPRYAHSRESGGALRRTQ